MDVGHGELVGQGELVGHGLDVGVGEAVGIGDEVGYGLELGGQVSLVGRNACSSSGGSSMTRVTFCVLFDMLIDAVQYCFVSS